MQARRCAYRTRCRLPMKGCWRRASGLVASGRFLTAHHVQRRRCGAATLWQMDDDARRESARRRANEAKKLRAAALRAALSGTVGPWHGAQEEAALALLPRLRRWMPLTGLNEAAIRNAASHTLRSLVVAAPAVWVAVIKTWVHGWPTPLRRGRGSRPGPCGREAGDRIAHLVSCRRLAAAVSEASGLKQAASVAAAVGLGVSPRVGSSAAAGCAPPEHDLLFLGCVSRFFSFN